MARLKAYMKDKPGQTGNDKVTDRIGQQEGISMVKRRPAGRPYSRLTKG
jgi:hypothetical protein